MNRKIFIGVDPNNHWVFIADLPDGGLSPYLLFRKILRPLSATKFDSYYYKQVLCIRESSYSPSFAVHKNTKEVIQLAEIPKDSNEYVFFVEFAQIYYKEE
jgi:hypothetical protein